jgi:signal transduction histidine kinase
VELRAAGDLHQLNEAASVTLFQSVRELLTNAAKHAEATRVVISVTEQEDALAISVTDNGKGFDAEAARRRARRDSFGLFSIQERVAHLGGSFTLDTTPGVGSCFTIVSPLYAPDSESGA